MPVRIRKEAGVSGVSSFDMYLGFNLPAVPSTATQSLAVASHLSHFENLFIVLAPSLCPT